ncbi:hypothetical protein ACLOJK_002010, partial [Asimina triloba]
MAGGTGVGVGQELRVWPHISPAPAVESTARGRSFVVGKCSPPTPRLASAISVAAGAISATPRHATPHHTKHGKLVIKREMRRLSA